MMAKLTPFVYWAQTADIITLKVDLKDVKDTLLDVSEENVKFSAKGSGAHEQDDYGFEINLHSKIDTENGIPQCTVYDSKVELLLKKKESGWWPRLTAQPQKPIWLKVCCKVLDHRTAAAYVMMGLITVVYSQRAILGFKPQVLPAKWQHVQIALVAFCVVLLICEFHVDFDRWKVDSSMHDTSDDEARDIMKDYPNAYDDLSKYELGYRKEDLRKVYLAFYNAFQFVGFSYIIAVIGLRYSKSGFSSVATTYESVGSAFKFFQLLQVLEIMHPLFGYTKGGTLQPLVQVIGRIIILFVFLDGEPRMQTKPVIFYLFLTWSLIEMVRYPYYITQLYKLDQPYLTWLRYTLWIPLYPIGIVCECVIILRDIPYFEETGKYSVSLPNAWNFAFHLPTLMRIYLLFLSIPVAYMLMTHMYRTRVNKMRRYRRVTKCN